MYTVLPNGITVLTKYKDEFEKKENIIDHLYLTSKNTKPNDFSHEVVQNSTLKFYSMESIIRFPKWEHLNRITLINCQNIDSLPNWPNLESIEIHKCAGIKIIPQWPKIKSIECSYLDNLISVPKFSNLYCFRVNCCPKLQKLNCLKNAEIVSVDLRCIEIERYLRFLSKIHPEQFEIQTNGFINETNSMSIYSSNLFQQNRFVRFSCKASTGNININFMGYQDPFNSIYMYSQAISTLLLLNENSRILSSESKNEISKLPPELIRLLSTFL